MPWQVRPQVQSQSLWGLASMHFARHLRVLMVVAAVLVFM
jgi:hypothetical protein